MRAGECLNFRDIKAGRLSWQRALQVADRMPADQPGREAMRIAPRALLCATAFRTGYAFDEQAFEETCGWPMPSATRYHPRWRCALARLCRGVEGWQADLAHAVAMVREFIPIGEPDVLFWKYTFGVCAGALRPDAAAVRETAEILRLAQQRADDLSVWSARFLHGFVLAQQPEPERGRGLSLLSPVREAVTQERSLADFSAIDRHRIREGESAARRYRRRCQATAGDSGSARVVPGGVGPERRATEVLVELLLQQGRPADTAAARDAIERVESMPHRVRSRVVRNCAAATAGTPRTSIRRRTRVSAVPGSVSHHGERDRLRRAYRHGRGDDLTALRMV